MRRSLPVAFAVALPRLVHGVMVEHAHGETGWRAEGAGRDAAQAWSAEEGQGMMFWICQGKLPGSTIHGEEAAGDGRRNQPAGMSLWRNISPWLERGRPQKHHATADLAMVSSTLNQYGSIAWRAKLDIAAERGTGEKPANSISSEHRAEAGIPSKSLMKPTIFSTAEHPSEDRRDAARQDRCETGRRRGERRQGGANG